MRRCKPFECCSQTQNAAFSLTFSGAETEKRWRWPWRGNSPRRMQVHKGTWRWCSRSLRILVPASSWLITSSSKASQFHLNLPATLILSPPPKFSSVSSPENLTKWRHFGLVNNTLMACTDTLKTSLEQNYGTYDVWCVDNPLEAVCGRKANGLRKFLKLSARRADNNHCSKLTKLLSGQNLYEII